MLEGESNLIPRNATPLMTTPTPTQEQLEAHIKRWSITQVYEVFRVERFEPGDRGWFQNRVESLVHELCHLATLGSPLPTRSTYCLLSGYVSREIDARLRNVRAPRYRSIDRADTNEIHTVGLEIEVMRAIGFTMPLDAFLALAIGNVRNRRNRRRYRHRVNNYRDSDACTRLVAPVVSYLCGAPCERVDSLDHLERLP